ncbi:hypothetical protein [Thalassospira xiamenensis]|uniref:Uncharacterized protein n=1 Tax=Thalassospira xiamenensis TaxID=220697 RepID=A0A285TSH6_9PROT|nr:hypothetical protein [Thalassospira xiamenensis]SOC26611.1 hypothetical protein SAMN05428964_105144 [Thalassospira xiamenensis]
MFDVDVYHQSFVEPKRAKRIHHRMRMEAKALNYANSNHLFGEPDLNRDRVKTKDTKGQRQQGLTSWASVEEARRAWAKTHRDTLKDCQCCLCSNPRARFKTPTMQEHRAALSQDEQIQEYLAA